VSKSSLSTHLNGLIASGKVEPSLIGRKSNIFSSGGFLDAGS
jgi:hypothetical protein